MSPLLEPATYYKRKMRRAGVVLRTIWRQFLAERVTRSVSARSAPAIDAKIASAEERILALVGADAGTHVAAEQSKIDRTTILKMVEALRSEFRELAASVAAHDSAIEAQEAAMSAIARIVEAQPALDTLFVPAIGLSAPTPGPFMEWSTCSAADFIRPQFAGICAELSMSPRYHRKFWEWVFVIHHLRRLGMLTPGRRGLVFGVGLEPLPSLFAKLGVTVMATDAPQDIGAPWSASGQFTTKLNDLHMRSIVDEETFHQRVSYATCDMNMIGHEFTGFDFCWSSCCFEHLGDLQAGLDFVVNSVNRTLAPGGVAVHTTEFNLSSDDATIESGPTVIYRKRDIENLIQRLRASGHEVDEFRVAPDHHPFDFYADVPPYKHNPHLRLNLLGFTSTSAGLVIRRGR